jgi:5-(carboxyamino)imidazole ribonucleotide mutase
VALLANHDAALRQKLNTYRAEQTELARAMTLPPVGAA